MSDVQIGGQISQILGLQSVTSAIYEDNPESGSSTCLPGNAGKESGSYKLTMKAMPKVENISFSAILDIRLMSVVFSAQKLDHYIIYL